MPSTSSCSAHPGSMHRTFTKRPAHMYVSPYAHRCELLLVQKFIDWKASAHMFFSMCGHWVSVPA